MTGPVEIVKDTPPRPLAPSRREGSPEARRAFEAAVGRQGGEPLVKANGLKDEPRKPMLLRDGEPTLLGELPGPVMKFARDEQQPGSGGNDGRAAVAEARTAAAPDAPAPSQAPTAADSAHWTAMLERVAAPAPGTAGETHLTLPDTRWLAREAVLATGADGALSLDLSMNSDGENPDADAQRLKERLEARGLVVARVTAREG